MKSRMLLSPLWKIRSWKKLFLCGKKSMEKPTVELPREIIESEVLPRLHAKSLGLDGPVFAELVQTHEYAHEYAFWNPLTGAYMNLSNSPKFYSPYDAFGIYFDSDKKDYKVLQWSCFGSAFKALSYSQRLNSTKEIQWLENHQQFSDAFWSNPISLGESLYFMGKKSYGVANRNRFWIIVFEVKSKKFREIRFPLLNQENPYNNASLMVIKGCIHIFVCRCLKLGGELWRMDGDGDRWTKVKDFPPVDNHP
ncbi:F-box domain containing protein [Tanacetum coccineum]